MGFALLLPLLHISPSLLFDDGQPREQSSTVELPYKPADTAQLLLLTMVHRGFPFQRPQNDSYTLFEMPLSCRAVSRRSPFGQNQRTIPICIKRGLDKWPRGITLVIDFHSRHWMDMVKFAWSIRNFVLWLAHLTERFSKLLDSLITACSHLFSGYNLFETNSAAARPVRTSQNLNSFGIAKSFPSKVAINSYFYHTSKLHSQLPLRCSTL